MYSFNETVESPEIWFQKAWEMFEASKINFEAFKNHNSMSTDRDRHRKNGLMSAAKLCLSLAIENGLKGAYVYKLKPEFSKNKYSENKFSPKHFHERSHDLGDLAYKLGIELSQDDNVLLKRFSSFIIWAAKYKSPLSEEEFTKFQGENILSYPKDFEFVEHLLEVLQLQSGYSIENGWPYKS
jgi:hypothetical protein